jgi:hypothetical protein
MSDSDSDSFYGGFSDSDSEVSIVAAGYNVPDDEPVNDTDPIEYLSNNDDEPVNYFSESEENKEDNESFIEEDNESFIEEQEEEGFIEETPLVSLMSGIKKLEI